MLAYFAQASGPLQCLSNRSTSANSKTALLVGQIFQWRGWENKANCYRISRSTSTAWSSPSVTKLCNKFFWHFCMPVGRYCSCHTVLPRQEIIYNRNFQKLMLQNLVTEGITLYYWAVQKKVVRGWSRAACGAGGPGSTSRTFILDKWVHISSIT